MAGPTPDQLTDLGREVSSLVAKVDMLLRYGETVGGIFGALLVLIAGLVLRLLSTTAKLPTREDLNKTVGDLRLDFKDRLHEFNATQQRLSDNTQALSSTVAALSSTVAGLKEGAADLRRYVEAVQGADIRSSVARIEQRLAELRPTNVDEVIEILRAVREQTTKLSTTVGQGVEQIAPTLQQVSDAIRILNEHLARRQL
jgi:methyl-accepting chemotaxis protein